MGPGMEVQTYERMTLVGKRWFFRIVDTGNNERLAAGQTYKTLRQRDVTAKRFAGAMAIPLRKVAR